MIVLAPQAWADGYIQTTVTPKPTTEVRVMLGRFELLTEQDEAEMLQQIAVVAKKSDLGVLNSLGFFAEPKARRAAQARLDPSVQAFATELIKAAEKLP